MRTGIESFTRVPSFATGTPAEVDVIAGRDYGLWGVGGLLAACEVTTDAGVRLPLTPASGTQSDWGDFHLYAVFHAQDTTTYTVYCQASPTGSDPGMATSENQTMGIVSAPDPVTPHLVTFLIGCGIALASFVAGVVVAIMAGLRTGEYRRQ